MRVLAHCSLSEAMCMSVVPVSLESVVPCIRNGRSGQIFSQGYSKMSVNHLLRNRAVVQTHDPSRYSALLSKDTVKVDVLRSTRHHRMHARGVDIPPRNTRFNRRVSNFEVPRGPNAGIIEQVHHHMYHLAAYCHYTILRWT